MWKYAVFLIHLLEFFFFLSIKKMIWLVLIIYFLQFFPLPLSLRTVQNA